MKMFREYEFSFNGFNFVSIVDIEGSMYKTIKTLPESIFIEMNIGALSNLLKDTPMTLPAIKERLIQANVNGSQAFIELGVNN